MSSSLWRALLSGTALAASIGIADAQTAGTKAGTTIANQAQASYSVNGTPATVQSNISTFKVDRKVDFTLTAQAAATQVNLGQTGAVIAFTLTNHTNDAQDFWLDPDQQNLSLGVLPGSDNFDVVNMKAYADADGNGRYDPAVDTRPYVDELAPDAAVTVFIVADIPADQAARLAHMSMHVIVAAGGQAGTKGALLIPTDINAVNQDDEVDIVFADYDSDGAFLGDLPRNGQARAYAAYEVGTHAVALTVAKSSHVLGDGVNLANGKALPGATIEYCLLVRNATLLTPASNVVLTDLLPENTTYVPGSITLGLPGGTCILAGEAQDDDADDANDGRTYAGAYNAATRTVTATMPQVAGGGALAAAFRVTIN